MPDTALSATPCCSSTYAANEYVGGSAHHSLSDAHRRGAAKANCRPQSLVLLDFTTETHERPPHACRGEGQARTYRHI